MLLPPRGGLSRLASPAPGDGAALDRILRASNAPVPGGAPLLDNEGRWWSEDHARVHAIFREAGRAAGSGCDKTHADAAAAAVCRLGTGLGEEVLGRGARSRAVGRPGRAAGAVASFLEGGHGLKSKMANMVLLECGMAVPATVHDSHFARVGGRCMYNAVGRHQMWLHHSRDEKLGDVDIRDGKGGIKSENSQPPTSTDCEDVGRCVRGFLEQAGGLSHAAMAAMCHTAKSIGPAHCTKTGKTCSECPLGPRCDVGGHGAAPRREPAYEEPYALAEIRRPDAPFLRRLAAQLDSEGPEDAGMRRLLCALAEEAEELRAAGVPEEERPQSEMAVSVSPGGGAVHVWMRARSFAFALPSGGTYCGYNELVLLHPGVSTAGALGAKLSSGFASLPVRATPMHVFPGAMKGSPKLRTQARVCTRPFAALAVDWEGSRRRYGEAVLWMPMLRRMTAAQVEGAAGGRPRRTSPPPPEW